MPTVEPFRALRYAADAVADLTAVVAPPYDVIDAEARQRLAARDPHNVVRLDLPIDEPGDEPDERYRRAGRELSAWRADGTLRRDPRPSLYPYEQSYTLPGTTVERSRMGLFARVRLEPFGSGSGIRAHERTLSAPKEDRYRLLRATNVNTSPVVGLYDDASRLVPDWLSSVGASASGASWIGEVVDDDAVRHRLWRVSEPAEEIEAICRAIGASPITIADGHHRYETALRYRDERTRGAGPDLEHGWDWILMLLLEPLAGPLTVLATHRVLTGIAGSEHTGMSALGELFAVEPAGRDRLIDAFGAPEPNAGGRGRFGLWTRDGGFLLTARRPAFEAQLPVGGEALRRLDVTLAGVAIERLTGIDAAATEGGRVRYTKDVVEAAAWVDKRVDGADAALLLEPTREAEIVAVAAEGDVMPQKSTYIYPKALTGLVINPLE